MKSITKTHQPKAYAKDAVKRLGKLISGIKQSLDEETLEKLRALYMLAYNQNSSDNLNRMIKILNEKRYQTRSSFDVISCYHEKHGHNYLEVREDRF